MPAALALCVAGSVGFARLTAARRHGAAKWAALAMIAITADTWPSVLPLVPVPAAWTADTRDVAAIIELPFGLVEFDAAAMFRSIQHQVPTINGMSGSVPPHYRALSRALLARDTAALETLAAIGPVLIAVRQQVSEPDQWSPLLDTLPSARRVGRDGDWVFYRLDVPPSGPAVCDAPDRKPVGVQNEDGAVPIGVITDDDPTTMWNSRYEGTKSEVLRIDLGRAVRLCGVGLSLGSAAYTYPKELTVETSNDGNDWLPARSAALAAPAIRGALRNQTDARIDVALPDVEARWIRLRRVPSEDTPVWLIAEVYFKAR
jgi:hypothetical protein